MQKTRTKRLLALLTTTLMLVAFFTACSPQNWSGEDEDNAGKFNKSITILHTNDIHGADASIDAVSGEESDTIIGMDVVAAALDDYKSKGPTFMLDAGDAFQGYYFVGENEGQAAVEIMNAVGYDAMTLGNHDFDYGWFRLQNILGELKFPALSQLNDAEAQEVKNLKAHTVLEQDGIKLGVFGLTTPETQFKSDGGFGRDFGTLEDMVAFSKEQVRILTEEEKVDFVVCLSHLGTEDTDYGSSFDIRDQVEGIDLIIDGHSHTPFDEIDNATSKTAITSTGAYGDHLGYAVLKKGDRLNSSTLLESWDKEYLSRKYKGRKDVTEIINKWNEEVKKEGSTVVAQMPFDLSIKRENERTKETVMGNITTDAMREVSGADIAMQNGGSIRDQELTQGDVTKAQLVTIFPYGNVLQMAEVKGSVIKEVLEQSVGVYPEANGGFMQVSGLSFTFDPSQDKGSRVTEVTVGGSTLEPDKIYKLCINDFVAYGGDEYTMLVEPFKKQLPLATPELAPLEKCVINYLTEHQKELKNETQGRITAIGQ